MGYTTPGWLHENVEGIELIQSRGTRHGFLSSEKPLEAPSLWTEWTSCLCDGYTSQDNNLDLV